MSMMTLIRRVAVAACLGVLAQVPAHALTVSTPLAADGSWTEFLVGADWSGSLDWVNDNADTLAFTLTGPAMLRVVDLGQAGDTFDVVVDGQHYATSGVALATYDGLPHPIYGDDAWADVSYSRLSLQLLAGSHVITGSLLQSVMLPGGGGALNSTSGAISISAVPEPASVATFALGLLALAAVQRRSRRG